jgi:molybdopterin synthase catalytic subunit
MDDDAIFTAILTEPLDEAAGLAFVQAARYGAAASFVGRVRDHHEGAEVAAVTYDVHAPLCLRVFRALADEVRAAHGPDLRVYLAHRHGFVRVGEASVVAAVGCAHRQPSFDALRDLIEGMKRRAPIWKLEHVTGGDARWTAGHSLRDET